MRRQRSFRFAGAAGAVALSAGALAIATPVPAGAEPVTETFGFTGAAQSFTVPADVCAITVTARGAAGGTGAGDEENAVGGLGGEAIATLTVEPDLRTSSD